MLCFTIAAMIKTIRKVGHLQGENRTVTITPVRRTADPAVVAGTIRQTIGEHSKTLKKLA